MKSFVRLALSSLFAVLPLTAQTPYSITPSIGPTSGGTTGGTPPEFERVLLPVFTPPVHGAFRSEFHTDLVIANHGDHPVTLYGIGNTCLILCPTATPTRCAYPSNPRPVCSMSRTASLATSRPDRRR